jgi:hypothetical protein
VKPELAIVVAFALAVAVRILWRELVSAIAVGCLGLVFIGILYLFAVTSPESFSGT